MLHASTLSKWQFSSCIGCIKRISNQFQRGQGSAAWQPTHGQYIDEGERVNSYCWWYEWSVAEPPQQSYRSWDCFLASSDFSFLPPLKLWSLLVVHHISAFYCLKSHCTITCCYLMYLLQAPPCYMPHQHSWTAALLEIRPLLVLHMKQKYNRTHSRAAQTKSP